MLMRIRKNMHWLGLYSGGDSEVNCQRRNSNEPLFGLTSVRAAGIVRLGCIRSRQ